MIPKNWEAEKLKDDKPVNKVPVDGGECPECGDKFSEVGRNTFVTNPILVAIDVEKVEHYLCGRCVNMRTDIIFVEKLTDWKKRSKDYKKRVTNG